MTRRFSYLLAIVAIGSACATTFRRHADRIPAALMTLDRDSLPRYLVIRVRSCPVVPLVSCVSSGGADAL